MNQMNPATVIKSPSTDPYLNLAIEEYLLSHFKTNSLILFLYRNSPCVVIGRFQIPWKECRPDFLKEKGIPLLRRISGGGAVYHDMGNLNFSLISAKGYFSQNRYLLLVLECLRVLGLKTGRIKRNSVFIKGHKVSGNAFRFAKERSLFHGTLLINTNLKNLKDFLTPAFTDQECGGGVSSIRNKVTNLSYLDSSIDMNKVIKALTEVFTGSTKTRVINTGNWLLPESGKTIHNTTIKNPEIVPGSLSTSGEIRRHEEIRALILKNNSFEWVYGNTPDSEIRISLNFVESNSRINKVNLTINTDKSLNCIIMLKKGRIDTLFIPGQTNLSAMLLKDSKNMPFQLSLLNDIKRKIEKKGN